MAHRLPPSTIKEPPRLYYSEQTDNSSEMGDEGERDGGEREERKERKERKGKEGENT